MRASSIFIASIMTLVMGAACGILVIFVAFCLDSGMLTVDRGPMAVICMIILVLVGLLGIAYVWRLFYKADKRAILNTGVEE